MNVILIGMPGAGKSTVGVILAKMLASAFLDTDLLIQERTGVPLCRTIESQGIGAFLQIEEDTLCGMDIPGGRSGCVISTGGSVIYSRKAMARMHRLGMVVYLKVGCEQLLSRLGDLRRRGVVLSEGETFQQLYEERTRRYEEEADLVLDEGQMSLEQTVEALYGSIMERKEQTT